LARARLVFVTGTPGVGKTILAKMLANELGLKFVDLGRAVKLRRLYSRYDRLRRSYVTSEELVRRNWARIVRDGAVVSTHFLVKGLLLGPGTVGVVLRLDPVVLWRRLRARGWSRSKTWENVESELLDICYFDAVRTLSRRRVFEIDTTSKSKSRTFREVLGLIEKRPKEHVQRVDWLSTYDPVELGRRFGVG
jgi:adenylate kinase